MRYVLPLYYVRVSLLFALNELTGHLFTHQMFSIPIFVLLVVNHRKGEYVDWQVGLSGVYSLTVSYRSAIRPSEPLHLYGYTCNFEKGRSVYSFLVVCLTFGGMVGEYMLL